MPNMKLPIETQPALWGAAGGAIALAIIGFNYGGWVTGGTADRMGSQKARLAVTTALAPICVDKFKRDPRYNAHLAELTKADSWARGTVIEKGGWATMPGASAPEVDVGAACANLIVGS
jgi:hypothetical protein